jgi:hypothetical protein
VRARCGRHPFNAKHSPAPSAADFPYRADPSAAAPAVRTRPASALMDEPAAPPTPALRRTRAPTPPASGLLPPPQTQRCDFAQPHQARDEGSYVKCKALGVAQLPRRGRVWRSPRCRQGMSLRGSRALGPVWPSLTAFRGARGYAARRGWADSEAWSAAAPLNLTAFRNPASR